MSANLMPWEGDFPSPEFTLERSEGAQDDKFNAYPKSVPDLTGFA